ncbi:MAG: DUF2892 domain-containing protein [Pseudomonas sp.]
MTQLSGKDLSKNVPNWERTVSVLGGLALAGRGLKKGGLSGIVQLAMGGMAVARGVTGHCEAKRLLDESLQDRASDNRQDKAAVDQRYSHMPMDSEVHSPDFENPKTKLPDATPMGNEAVAPAGNRRPGN